MTFGPFRPASDPFEQFWSALAGPRGGYSRGQNLMRSPDTDVVETQHEIRVVAELPGVKRDDIDIDLENNVLTIRAEKRDERVEGEQATYHLAERRYGRLSRSFVLPRDVDQEAIQARYDDGVLTVTIPRSERARRRRIDIETGANGAGAGGGER